MIRFKVSIVYIVGLMMVTLSTPLCADELALEHRLYCEIELFYSLREKARRNAEPFTFMFDPELVQLVGREEIMQRLFPDEEEGELEDVLIFGTVSDFVNHALEGGNMPGTLHPVGDSSFEEEESFSETSPSLPDSSPFLSEGDVSLEGLLSDIFEQGMLSQEPCVGHSHATPLAFRQRSSVTPPEVPVNQRATRRSLLAELDAAPDRRPLAVHNSEALYDLEGARLAAEAILEARLQLSPESREISTAANRLMDMLIELDGPQSSVSPASIAVASRLPGARRRLVMASPRTPQSGNKRTRDVSQETTPVQKRSRTEEPEEFLTPGDLSPIYDLFKTFRTPDDENGNGGGGSRGCVGAPLKSSKSLHF